MNGRALKRKITPVHSTYICSTCNEEKSSTYFYKIFDKTVLSGKFLVCKDCIKNICTVDDEISTEKLKDILQKMDRPFIQDIFEKKLEEDSDPIGTYFSTLSFPKFNKLKWNDSNYINKKVINAENTRAEYNIEWLGTYNSIEIAYLEEYLGSLKEDFKISTRNHLDYARKIAKASLAMDKAYDELTLGKGGEKKYQTLKEVFDTLSKSASFAESGRGINDVSLGCFGTTFDRVEKNTWIYQHIPEDKDTYDLLLDQFANINKSLM